MEADMTDQGLHVIRCKSIRRDPNVREDYEAPDPYAFHSILFPP